ncbi:MOSC domain-containing protein [Cryobacterium frigoriphilum]|uniref:MOSC domain-containing protein n=1 Tax=Cryobacterium frigoriphilum TaxID=1259150 RepID=A0A4R8ZV15_9MICO|nr:MOSC domain-containing protein [Cryobacterium frigoriphilum]TFD46985.1 MOSC domain-containing protein [Cryobacterium frigoriphilum]
MNDAVLNRAVLNRAVVNDAKPSVMRVREIGVSALKGGRHRPRTRIALSALGPVGDRVFAVVDLADGRVLKTVEHPSLVGCDARWQCGVLSISIDGQQISGTPTTDATPLTLDYWGRPVSMRNVRGPWSPAFSRLLGRPVALARVDFPGEVVYGDTVTLATTSSLERLARESGTPVDPRRFRSTFTIDTGEADAHLEDCWAGRELEVGGARLLVGAGIPRCAVIDLDPHTGARGAGLLKILADYRLDSGEIMFGVYARVVRPGLVGRGDPVRLLPAP